MHILTCGRHQLSLSHPLVMGILNVTPDSFSDGGVYFKPEQALQQAERLLQDGATFLDIGGESTRPNAAPVSIQEEMDRVLPVLEALQGCGAVLSVDTRRTAVMQAALAIGVDLINDVSALEDEGALTAVAPHSAAICLMHKQGNPDTMQRAPHYERDVVLEVADYLQQRVNACEAVGIARERLLIDPGFGFGKTLAHNLRLLAQLPSLTERVPLPLLVGLSRKSMLGQICDEPVATERLGASVAAALWSAQYGAKIIRVHDVKATVQALKVWQAVTEYA